MGQSFSVVVFSLFGCSEEIRYSKKKMSKSQPRLRKINEVNTYAVNSIVKYRLPVLRETKGCNFIEYYSFNPATGKLARVRIKLNRIQGKLAMRQYAKDLIARLTEKLLAGWSPFVDESNVSMKEFSQAVAEYKSYILRLYQDGVYREQTYISYASYLNNFETYNSRLKNKAYYVYQLDQPYCVSFLDEIFIVRKNCAQTRNNYLAWMQTFFSWLKGRGYISYNPTESIEKISKRLISKTRKIIPLDLLPKISEWCKQHDPYFLLACYLLYYTMIRPQELCRLRVGDVNLSSSTLTLTEDESKNRKRQTVTLNNKVCHYILELGVLSSPSSDFLFSSRLKPGRIEIDPVNFRHHWDACRKALRFSDSYKFYSLKDTGITELADNRVASINIRDQARHSNLAITDIYTRHGSSAAIPELQHYSGSL